MTVERVKSDLRLIKYGRSDIDGMISTLERKKKHLAFLMETKASQNYIKRIRAFIENKEKEINDKIYQLDDLEQRYEEAISSLDVIDRLVIREGIFGGKTHCELAELLGYSVRGIESRMQRVFEKLAAFD